MTVRPTHRSCRAAVILPPHRISAWASSSRWRDDVFIAQLRCKGTIKKDIVFCKVVAGRAGNKPALPAHSCFIRMGSCKSESGVFAHLSADLWCRPSTDVLSCRRIFDRKHQARHAFCIQTTWPLLIGYIIFLLNTIFSIFSMFYGHKLHEKYVLPKSFLRKYVVLPKFIFVIYVVLPKSF